MPDQNDCREQIFYSENLGFDYGFFIVSQTGFEKRQWFAPWHRFRPKQIVFSTLEKSGLFALDVGVGVHPSPDGEESISRSPLWVQNSATISTFDEPDRSIDLESGFHSVWLSQWLVANPNDDYSDSMFRFVLTFEKTLQREPAYERRD